MVMYVMIYSTTIAYKIKNTILYTLNSLHRPIVIHSTRIIITRGIRLVSVKIHGLASNNGGWSHSFTRVLIKMTLRADILYLPLQSL
jgi:hypothetical protein